MEQQTISIKGMVCNRCVMTIENELLQMGHTPLKVSLGKASFLPDQRHDHDALADKLGSLGFTLLPDKNEKMVTGIKNMIAEVYGGDYDFPGRFRFSDLLRHKFQKDYRFLSDAFIASEKKTIEQYIIAYRIDKVKEALVYTNNTLTDIAFRLNFNGVAHLSTQFRQQTGLTPSYFRNIKKQKRKG